MRRGKLRSSLVLAIALSITTGVFGSAFFFASFRLDRRPASNPGVDRSPLPPRWGSCRVNADCPQGEACAIDEMGHAVECRPDECAEDRDCLQGRVCRRVGSITGEPGPRMCVQKGIRKEGERCTDTPKSAEQACKASLYCQFLFCGRACELERPESCPGGFVCRKGIDRPSCLPSCEGQSCPEGKQCVHFAGKNFSACTEVMGENCQVNPCPLGKECYYFITDDSERVAMTCSIPCIDNSSCPEGNLCDHGYCAQRCFPQNRKACGPGRVCVAIDRERLLYVCTLNP